MSDVSGGKIKPEPTITIVSSEQSAMLSDYVLQSIPFLASERIANIKMMSNTCRTVANEALHSSARIQRCDFTNDSLPELIQLPCLAQNCTELRKL